MPDIADEKKKARAASMPLPGAQAISISEFCAENGIGRTTFYELMKDGKAPRRMKVRGRVLIPVECAAEWRRQYLEPQPSVAA
jgi:predicted DNA-binding transcriptional regulator AlpA